MISESSTICKLSVFQNITVRENNLTFCICLPKREILL